MVVKKINKTINGVASKKLVAKKSVTKVAKPKLIGKVTHYFDNLGVAVVRLAADLKVGDNIRIEGGEKTDFKQTVKSLQFNHQKLLKAKKGQEVGLKIKEIARDGYRVYKV